LNYDVLVGNVTQPNIAVDANAMLVMTASAAWIPNRPNPDVVSDVELSTPNKALIVVIQFAILRLTVWKLRLWKAVIPVIARNSAQACISSRDPVVTIWMECISRF
jgi:hypothetical protein